MILPIVELRVAIWVQLLSVAGIWLVSIQKFPIPLSSSSLKTQQSPKNIYSPDTLASA
jgi:hypothetical protein